MLNYEDFECKIGDIVTTIDAPQDIVSRVRSLLPQAPVMQSEDETTMYQIMDFLLAIRVSPITFNFLVYIFLEAKMEPGFSRCLILDRLADPEELSDLEYIHYELALHSFRCPEWIGSATRQKIDEVAENLLSLLMKASDDVRREISFHEESGKPKPWKTIYDRFPSTCVDLEIDAETIEREMIHLAYLLCFSEDWSFETLPEWYQAIVHKLKS